MEDTRNFIEYTQDRAKHSKVAKELSPAEMAAEFVKVGPNERMDHLVRLDGDLKATSFSSPEEAAKFHAHRRALNNAHRRLMDLDR